MQSELPKSLLSSQASRKVIKHRPTESTVARVQQAERIVAGLNDIYEQAIDKAEVSESVYEMPSDSSDHRLKQQKSPVGMDPKTVTISREGCIHQDDSEIDYDLPSSTFQPESYIYSSLPQSLASSTIQKAARPKIESLQLV